jgi:hypothetical protein
VGIEHCAALSARKTGFAQQLLDATFAVVVAHARSFVSIDKAASGAHGLARRPQLPINAMA